MGGEERFEEIGDVLNRLGMDGRVEPEGAWMQGDIRNDEDCAEAQEFVNRAVHDSLCTAHTLARRTGLTNSAVSAFRTGNWKGATDTRYATGDKLVKAVNAILRERRDSANRIAGGCVETSIARAVKDLIQETIKRPERGMSVVVGPAGCGKSTVLSAAAEATPGAILLTCTGLRANRRAFMQLLCDGIGIVGGGPAHEIFDRCVGRLVGSARLLLVDESQQLHVNTLDCIRSLWDQTHIPIVLSATTQFKAQISELRRPQSTHADLLDVIKSRCQIVLDLGEQLVSNGGGAGVREMLVTEDDIRRLFNTGKVKLSRDGVKYLVTLACTPASGALRTCSVLVQRVLDLFKDETVITREMLHCAYIAKVGRRDAEVFAEHVRDGDGIEVAAAAG